MPKIKDVEVVEKQAEQVEEVKNEKPADHSALPFYKIKARSWQAVGWSENLVEDWEMKVAEAFQLPFAYCIHDKDVKSDGSPRNEHVHFIVVFPNTTTYNHALNVFKLLGEKAFNTCEPCRNIRWCYDYLIHDTEDARKKNKHQYEECERVRGNNFDIGFFEQVSLQERREMLGELIDFIIEEGFTNLIDFTIESKRDDRFSGVLYQDVRIAQTNTLDKYIAGNYKKLTNGCKSKRVNNGVNLHESTKSPRKVHEVCCPVCGSINVRKKGKSAGGEQRFCCKDCGKTWTN